MANEACLADHRRSTFSVGPFTLGKRRDGASDVWCATWYDGRSRTLRHRSLRTRDFDEAKTRLTSFAQSNPDLANRQHVTDSEPDKVYFIGGDVGAVKIGLAGDCERRLKALQCGSPIPLRLLAVCEGGRMQERAYHARFAAYRLHGEWFEPHPDILAEIERLRTVPNHTPPACKGAA